MTIEEIRVELYNYCKQVIPDFDAKEKAALAIIAERGCSLYNADFELRQEMNNAIERYCEEHNLVNDYDTDLVFWEWDEE